eukprot:403358657
MTANITNEHQVIVNFTIDGEIFHEVAICYSDPPHLIAQKIKQEIQLQQNDEFELFPAAVTMNSQLNFTQAIGFSFQELNMHSGPQSQIQLALLNPYRGELIDQINYDQKVALHDIINSNFSDIAVDHVIRRKYKCFYINCRKTFEDTQSLFYHQKIHTNNKPFECPDCQKRFVSKTHLRSHSDIHLVNRPYKCQFRNCNKSYSKLNRLQTHLRTHTSDKIFKCPVAGCPKSFNEKGILKTHLRIHTGDKPYKCVYPGCKEMYSTKSILQEHLKKVHGEQQNEGSDSPTPDHISQISTLNTSSKQGQESQVGPLPKFSTQSFNDLKLDSTFNIPKRGLEFLHEEEKKAQSSKTLQSYANLPNYKLQISQSPQIQGMCFNQQKSQNQNVSQQIGNNGNLKKFIAPLSAKTSSNQLSPIGALNQNLMNLNNQILMQQKNPTQQAFYQQVLLNQQQVSPFSNQLQTQPRNEQIVQNLDNLSLQSMGALDNKLQGQVNHGQIIQNQQHFWSELANLNSNQNTNMPLNQSVQFAYPMVKSQKAFHPAQQQQNQQNHIVNGNNYIMVANDANETALQNYETQQRKLQQLQQTSQIYANNPQSVMISNTKDQQQLQQSHIFNPFMHQNSQRVQNSNVQFNPNQIQPDTQQNLSYGFIPLSVPSKKNSQQNLQMISNLKISESQSQPSLSNQLFTQQQQFGGRQNQPNSIQQPSLLNSQMSAQSAESVMNLQNFTNFLPNASHQQFAQLPLTHKFKSQAHTYQMTGNLQTHKSQQQ